MLNFWLVFYDEMRNFDKLRKAKCIDQLQQSSFADTFFNFPDRSRTRAVETDPNPRTRAVETPVSGRRKRTRPHSGPSGPAAKAFA